MTVQHPGHFTMGLVLPGAGMKEKQLRSQFAQATVSMPSTTLVGVRVRVRVR